MLYRWGRSGNASSLEVQAERRGAVDNYQFHGKSDKADRLIPILCRRLPRDLFDLGRRHPHPGKLDRRPISLLLDRPAGGKMGYYSCPLTGQFPLRPYSLTKFRKTQYRTMEGVLLHSASAAIRSETSRHLDNAQKSLPPSNRITYRLLRGLSAPSRVGRAHCGSRILEIVKLGIWESSVILIAPTLIH